MYGGGCQGSKNELGCGSSQLYVIIKQLQSHTIAYTYQALQKRRTMNTYEYCFAHNSKNTHKTAISLRLDNGGIRSYSYEQLFAHVDIFADALISAGIVPGDRVAIVAENCPEWCIAYLAIMKQKATAVLIDASLEQDEIWKLLRKSKVRGICTTHKIIEKPGMISDIPVFDILDNAKSFDGYNSKVSTKKTTDGDENISTILYSSGTTKTASGIMHSHDALLKTTNMVIESNHLRNDSRFLAILPNSHIYGLICQVIGSLMLGATLCFLESLNAEMLSGAFQDYRPTIFPAVPQMYEMLKSQAMRKINSDSKTQKLFAAIFPKCLWLRKKTGINLGPVFFKSIHQAFGGEIKVLCSAGAPLNAETADFFYGTGFDILITYGATETNIPTIGNYGRKLTTDTCGKAYPDVHVTFSSDGEILVKSPYIMLGYFDDETATLNAFNEDGWFKTGDLGCVDERGYIRILGRCKDNIVLATGKKVAPDDIEKAYEGIEEVQDLVVCGIPVSDGSYDEVYAFAVAEPSKVEAALEHLKQRSAALPFNMKLSEIRFVDAIPKTSLQKPKRYLLKQKLEQYEKPVMLPQAEHEKVTTDISSIVREAVANIAKVDVSEVLPETKLFSELAIDSLGSIELCCMVEEKCGIREDIAYVLHKKMTVAELTEYVSAPYDVKSETYNLLQNYPLKKSKYDYNIFRLAQNLMFMIYNIRIQNDTFLPKNGGYIICSNHVTNFDYLFLTLNFTWERFHRFCCMAKKELFGKKILSRTIAKIAGMVPVDRDGFVNDAFSTIRSKLGEGWGVLIYPEGTRSENGEIKTFKNGAAILSIEACVPIVPAYIEGGFKVFPKSRKLPNLFNWKKMKRYCVEVKYGEPVFPKGLSPDELTKHIEMSIMQLKAGVN